MARKAISRSVSARHPVGTPTPPLLSCLFCGMSIARVHALNFRKQWYAVPHAVASGVDSRIGSGEAHPRGARGGHRRLPRNGGGDDVSAYFKSTCRTVVCPLYGGYVAGRVAIHCSAPKLFKAPPRQALVALFISSVETDFTKKTIGHSPYIRTALRPHDC